MLMPQEEHDISTLLVEGLMAKPCGLISALVVDELFPPESFNMKFCASIDWVARHMIEMCALEGKNIAFTDGETLDTVRARTLTVPNFGNSAVFCGSCKRSYDSKQS